MLSGMRKVWCQNFFKLFSHIGAVREAASVADLRDRQIRIGK